MFKKKNKHKEGNIKITNIEFDSKMGSNEKE